MNCVDALFKRRARPERDPIELSERHGQRASIAEADHLAGRLAPFAAENPQPAAHADGAAGAGDFDEEPLHPGHPSEPGQTGKAGNAVDQCFHNAPKTPCGPGPIGAPESLTSWTRGFKWR